MKRRIALLLSLALAFSAASFTRPGSVTKAQNQNSNANSNSAPAKNPATANGPMVKVTADQIRQAQAILKQRGFYAGEHTGKLEPETRAGLKLYQAAEKIKVTGTLNQVTLEKLNITLTDKQNAM